MMPKSRDEENVLRILQETVEIGKREVVSGQVTIHVRTDTVSEPISMTLNRSEVEVTRVPVGRIVTSAPEIREEGEVTIIPILEERAVVHLELFLREELHVRRVRSTETLDVPVTRRVQSVDIDRDAEGAATPSPSTGKCEP